MTKYIIQRFAFMIVLLVLVSIVAFVIIQLPPGDYLTSYIVQLESEGTTVSESEIMMLKRQYGLDKPMYMQYLKWVSKMLQGDFGMSFMWQRPAADLLAERIPLTVLVSLFTLVFTYVVAVPIGIYSATNQYSIGDYAFTIVGFAGLAIPNFMLALILMLVFFNAFGLSIGGLFSPQFQEAAWSLAKFWDLVKHLPVPVIVVGTAGTAGIIRIMRGTLLDELKKQYVITARAKGVNEIKLLFEYPVRVAMNPIVSSIGWQLPQIISGATITSIVLNLPTTGPLLLQALLNQDMFLAGSTIMLLSFLTVVGMFLSDLLLVLVDPRIRLEKGAAA